MDGKPSCIKRDIQPALQFLAFTGLLLLGLVIVRPCHAESALRSSLATGGPVSASAHLDFRVTVLASMALSVQATGVRVQSNGGVLILQHEQRGAWDGRAPAGSGQLPVRRQVVDTSIPTASFAGSSLITLASP